MAKRKGVSLPSGQGGLVGSYDSAYQSQIQFPPIVVVVFALAVVIFVWLLNFIY